MTLREKNISLNSSDQTNMNVEKSILVNKDVQNNIKTLVCSICSQEFKTRNENEKNCRNCEKKNNEDQFYKLEEIQSIDEALDSIKPNIEELLEKGSKQNLKKIRQLIVDTIIRYESFVTISDTKVIYHYEEGIYIPNGEITIAKYCESVLNDQCDNTTVQEIIGKIRRITSKDESIFNVDTNYICVNNGILERTTRELLTHSPDYFFINKINAIFDPNAKKPTNFLNFLLGVLPGKHNEEKRQTLREFIGYCLYRKYPVPQFLILNGYGRNGKTTYSKLFDIIFGIKYIANLGILQLREKDASSELLGKLVNIAGEMNKVTIKNLDLLKQITGNDAVRIRPMYSKGFSSVLYSKMLFINNILPQFKELDDAIVERLIVIDFKERFSASDPRTVQDIEETFTTPEELSGILNLALDGLDNLLKNKHFSCYHGIEKNREYLLPKLNIFHACIDKDLLEFDSTFSVMGSDLFNFMTKFAIENNFNIDSNERSFYGSLFQSIDESITKKKTNSGIRIDGIRIKSKSDECDDRKIHSSHTGTQEKKNTILSSPSSPKNITKYYNRDSPSSMVSTSSTNQYQQIKDHITKILRNKDETKEDIMRVLERLNHNPHDINSVWVDLYDAGTIYEISNGIWRVNEQH